MKKLLLPGLVLAFSLLSFSVRASFFSDADAFLKANVSPSGGVYYEEIKKDPAALNGLVKQIANYNYKAADTKTKKAFLIIAYNILTIKNVVDIYPMSLPTCVNGFFDKKKFNVAGTQMTLSDIENKKIRPTFKDSRTHFALVCAAKSCPPLANYAYMPAKVEAQLDAVTKKALNNRNFIRVSSDKKSVQYSEIFNWYKDDFLAEAGSILEYINKYRTTAIPSSYSQGSYTYNWNLNVKKK